MIGGGSEEDTTAPGGWTEA